MRRSTTPVGRALQAFLPLLLLAAGLVGRQVLFDARPAQATTRDVDGTLRWIQSIAGSFGNPQLQITVRDLQTGEQWSLNGSNPMGYWSSYKWWAVAHTAAVVGYDKIDPDKIQAIFALSDNIATRDVVAQGGGLDALNDWTFKVAGMGASTCETTWYGLLPTKPCLLGRNTSTSEDAVEFLDRLYHGDLLGPADTTKVIDAALITPDTGEYHDLEPLAVRQITRHKAGLVGYAPFNGNSTIALYELPTTTYALAISMAQSSSGMAVQQDFTQLAACHIYRVMADPGWSCERAAAVGTEVSATVAPSDDPAETTEDLFGQPAPWIEIGDEATFTVQVTNRDSQPATVTVTLPCFADEVVVAADSDRQVQCSQQIGDDWAVAGWSINATGADGSFLGTQFGGFWLRTKARFAPALAVTVADANGGPFGPSVLSPAGTRVVHRIEVSNAASTRPSQWTLQASDPGCQSQLLGQGEWRAGTLQVGSRQTQLLMCTAPAGTNLTVRAIASAEDFANVSLQAATTSAVGGSLPARSQYVAVTPARIIDTRPGYASAQPSVIGPLGGERQADTIFHLPPAILPAGVAMNRVEAIDVKLTEVDADQPGWLSAQAGAWQLTSNLAYAPGQIASTESMVTLAPDGTFTVTTSAGQHVHLVVDLLGLWIDEASPIEAANFVPVTPHRILDTRQDSQIGSLTGPIGGLDLPHYTLKVRGADLGGGRSVPAEATALSLSVVGIAGTDGGWYDLRPSGTPYAGTSTGGLTQPGNTTAATVTVPIGDDGAIVLTSQLRGQLVIDVMGYFVAESAGDGYRFVPATPWRATDTRQAMPNRPAGGLTDGELAALAVAAPSPIGRFQVPDVKAVALNIQLLAGTRCFVTAWDGETDRPLASNGNCNDRWISTNPAIVGVGADGDVALFSQLDPLGRPAIDAVVDVQGYFV